MVQSRKNWRGDDHSAPLDILGSGAFFSTAKWDPNFREMTGVGRHWRPQDIGGKLFKLVGRGWAQSCAR
jgi:hypothetical protein